MRGSAPCSLTSGRPAGLAGGDDLLNSSSRGSGPAALPTHHNRELNPARPLCDPAWRRRFHTQIRPSWRTQAARPAEAARRAGVPQARSGPHCCGRCARRSHDHRLSHPRSRASSHCRCWRPGPAAQRGGAGASLALRGAKSAARARRAACPGAAARQRAGGPDGGRSAVSLPVEALLL